MIIAWVNDHCGIPQMVFFFYHLFSPYIIYSFIYLYHSSRILILSYGCNLLLSLFSFFAPVISDLATGNLSSFLLDHFHLCPFHHFLYTNVWNPLTLCLLTSRLNHWLFFFFSKEWYFEAETGVLGIVIDLVVWLLDALRGQSTCKSTSLFISICIHF